MASTSQYKATGRTVRSGMLEISPTAGMKFTNNPITEGYCKTMVNMDVDTTLSVLRPRNAYEDMLLKKIATTEDITDSTVADILFSGKLYVDVWDTSDVEAPEDYDTIETGQGSVLSDQTVEKVYGNTTIVPELRNIVIIGYGKHVEDGRTYYERTVIYEVYIDDNTGAPYKVEPYRDYFTNPNEDFVDFLDTSYYRACTTYAKLKGLNYAFPNAYYVQEEYAHADNIADILSCLSGAHHIKNGVQVLSDLINNNLYAGVGYCPRISYVSIPHTSYVTRSTPLAWFNNTVYFIGKSLTDSEEYTAFKTKVCNQLEAWLGTPSDTGPTIEERFNMLLEENTEWEDWVQRLQSPSLRALYLVERKLAGGQTIRYAMGMNVEPQTPAASEVINYGYNMLLRNPYNLQSDHAYTANTILLDGILVKDPVTLKTRLHARVGENLRFELLYKTNSVYMTDVGGVRVRWEITDVTSSGNTTVLCDIWDSEVYNEDSDIYFEFQPSYKTFSILCKVYREKDVQEVLADTSLATLEDKYNDLSPVRSITLASYTLTDRVANRQAELKEFDLTTAGGMVPWLERLVLWDIEGAETNIFVSEAGTTNYFPYPNGYDEFPAKVVKCLPYGQQLLVLTENELYLCTMNADGLTFTKQCIQTGLNINPSEKDNIVVIHNMVSFFSEDKIYLIVPKSGSLTGALQLAPISNQINYFLKDVENNSLAIIRRLYGLEDHVVYDIFREQWKDTSEDLSNLGNTRLKLVNKYTYVEGSKIVYTFVYDLQVQVKVDDWNSVWYNVIRASDEKLLVALVYDTNSRVWNLIMRQGSSYTYVPFEGGSSVDRQSLLTIKKYLDMGEDKHSLHLLSVTKNDTSVQDLIISNNGIDSIDNPDSPYFLYKNYQFLDTGYRLTDVSRKKRFREVQFNLNNIDGYEIPMGCAIFVDDNERKMLYNYSVNIVRTAENSAEAVVTQSIDTKGLVRNTTLGARDEDIVHYNKEYATGGQNMFLLDTTKFEQVSNYKVRIKTSGKGYSPRAQLLFKPRGYYELFYINWVYRSMSQR